MLNMHFYGQHIEHFLNYKKGVENCSDFTIKSYLSDLTLLFRFAKQKEVTEKFIVLWLGQWKTQATKARRVATLKSFFTYLTDRGIITEQQNPVRHLKLPKTSKLSPISYYDLFTADETVALLKVSPPMERAMYMLAMTSGLRARELLSIELKDIDMERQWGFVARRGMAFEGIKRKKGNFKFSKNAARAIKEYLPVRTKRGRKLFPISYDAYRSGLRKYGKRAGIAGSKLRLHIFRHMWATSGIKSLGGAPMELLGMSLRMQTRYGHHTMEDIDALYEKAFG